MFGTVLKFFENGFYGHRTEENNSQMSGIYLKQSSLLKQYGIRTDSSDNYMIA